MPDPPTRAVEPPADEDAASDEGDEAARQEGKLDADPSVPRGSQEDPGSV